MIERVEGYLAVHRDEYETMLAKLAPRREAAVKKRAANQEQAERQRRGQCRNYAAKHQISEKTVRDIDVIEGLGLLDRFYGYVRQRLHLSDAQVALVARHNAEAAIAGQINEIAYDRDRAHVEHDMDIV